MAGSDKGEKKQVFYPGEECWVGEKDNLHLVGSRCKKCGQNYFPVREICPKCFTEGEMDKIKLSSRGKLYSYSIVQIAPKRFMPPYAVGYVDFAEGVRVLGQLTTCDPDKLKLDMEVQTELGRIAIDEQGDEVISYKFKPL
jgi:scaffold protein (connect acetoacetyl-CoA thiolase and HMG-CoA synthase)